MKTNATAAQSSGAASADVVPTAPAGYRHVLERMLDRDELRLLAVHRILDGLGGVDLHARASELAAERNHEEPTDRDYLDATREALDVIVEEEFR